MLKILIVDDTPESIQILMEILKNPSYEILAATNGKTALEVATTQNLDLILLDIVMPQMDGYEVCARLKADIRTKRIPIIFITAQDDEINEVKGFELGAVDYITKPISLPIVQARVKTHLKLKLAYQELEEQNSILEEIAYYLAQSGLEHSYSLQSEMYLDDIWEQETFKGKRWWWSKKTNHN